MGIYSKDLRVRAVAAVDRGVPRAEVLETFSMSLTTLKRWLRMSREGKALSPRVSTGRKRRILATPEENKALWEQLEENDDATLERHCEMWEEKRGTRVSVATMSRAIRHKLGWSFKKRRWVPPSETKKLEMLGANT
jgi:transposase